jgi:hypothetical protein
LYASPPADTVKQYITVAKEIEKEKGRGREINNTYKRV